MRKILAFIVAFIVFALLGQFLILIGPALVGWTIYYFDVPPIGQQNVRTLESVGLIVNLFFSLYVGFKVYKKIAINKSQKDD